MQRPERCIVVLGTGGTIAGVADSAQDDVGYRSAQLGVAQLVQAVPALADQRIEAEQVAQIDSKDMDVATWQHLATRAAHHLARDAVAGVVVTHGTDTLEETAWFLHRVLGPRKPLVLTAAMRPASSAIADGPGNLLNAARVASHADACGVVVVMAGRVHAAMDVRKAHSSRIDAFDSGDAEPLALIDSSGLRSLRDWPESDAPLGLSHIAADASQWPWVELITSHAAARANAVEALVAAGVRGIVIAGTGMGTLHHELELALRRAQRSGVEVRLATRCALGPVVVAAVVAEPMFASYEGLSAVKSRVELMLELLGRSAPD